MNQVNQVNEIINNLASKLGMAVNKLFSVLVKQAYIEGVKDIVWAILCLAIITVITVILYKSFYSKDENGKYRRYDWDELNILGWFLSAIMVVICTFIMIYFVSNAITCLLNPEYAAIQMILDKIK